MKDNLRQVPGFEGLYKIDISTSEGRCWSGRSQRYLKNNLNKDGRIYWKLSKNGKSVTYQAAKWIALTYPELIQNDYFHSAEIDHMDTDKLNNRPENLRWVTRKENCNNPLTRKHFSECRNGKKATEETKRKISKTHSGEKHPFYGKHHSEESKQKMSETKKGEKAYNYGKHLSEKTKQKIRSSKLNHPDQSKEVIQLDLDGNIIAAYPSTMQAERETGVKHSNISFCCIGKAKTAGTRNGPKYIWKYKE